MSLQKMGTRTTITQSEYDNQTSNEAIQAGIILVPVRDQLLRMAPWDCATNFNNLTYISSTPGTPENPTEGTTTWEKGQPYPPWNYEYQYPVDCVRALWIVPQFQTGFSSGVPITTAVTGGAPTYWNGPPVRFKVMNDQFYSASAAAVVAGGTGYAVGDIITLDDTPDGDPPIGAPGQLLVATVAGSAVLTVTVVNQIWGRSPGVTGSYFEPPTNAVGQSETTGSGSGATFNLTLTSQLQQRVIMTNQQQAILAYLKRVIDPNVMDDLLIDAWASMLGARMTMSLTGDKTLANALVQLSNASILEARKADGNEGLTVNDVTPDWIRGRGIAYGGPGWSPGQGFDWGSLWPMW